jgi:histidinol phosphatase-like enzyme
MILRASSEWDVGLAESIFVGDNETDLQAAASAGVGRRISFLKESADPGVIVLQSLTDHACVFGEIR